MPYKDVLLRKGLTAHFHFWQARFNPSHGLAFQLDGFGLVGFWTGLYEEKYFLYCAQAGTRFGFFIIRSEAFVSATMKRFSNEISDITCSQNISAELFFRYRGLHSEI